MDTLAYGSRQPAPKPGLRQGVGGRCPGVAGTHAMAQRVDADTCRRILALEAQIRPEQACGALPVNGLLQQARHRQLQAELLASCNSGDTAGERERVVGYAAFAFFEGSPHDTRH